MIIGGAEDKLRKRRILREFVAASGGPEARIAVIPTASSLGDEIVDVYDALFRAEGAAEVTAVRPDSREQAGDPELVEQLEKAEASPLPDPASATTGVYATPEELDTPHH